nr:zinc finger, CCHC-type [Tanacetum cinerariifolium]
MFQQHQGESFSEAWTRFKDLLRKFPHHGIDLWLHVQIFYDRIDYTLKRIVDYAAGGWIRNMRSHDYENPDIKQLLGVMECKVDTLMKEAISLMGGSESVFGMTSNMVYQLPLEPSRQEEFEDLVMNFILDQEEKVRQLEEEASSFNEPEPQPNPLPSYPSLDVSLDKERGSKPPNKPYSLDGFRMEEVDHLTIHTLTSHHMAYFHPKGTYCYYHPCIDDLKKHNGFKPGLLGHSGSLGVDFLNIKMIENEWELEAKEVYFL